jgi:hypothetical protein
MRIMQRNSHSNEHERKSKEEERTKDELGERERNRTVPI